MDPAMINERQRSATPVPPEALVFGVGPTGLSQALQIMIIRNERLF
jgi:hypothetical protein